MRVRRKPAALPTHCLARKSLRSGRAGSLADCPAPLACGEGAGRAPVAAVSGRLTEKEVQGVTQAGWMAFGNEARVPLPRSHLQAEGPRRGQRLGPEDTPFDQDRGQKRGDDAHLIRLLPGDLCFEEPPRLGFIAGHVRPLLLLDGGMTKRSAHRLALQGHLPLLLAFCLSCQAAGFLSTALGRRHPAQGWHPHLLKRLSIPRWQDRTLRRGTRQGEARGRHPLPQRLGAQAPPLRKRPRGRHACPFPQQDHRPHQGYRGAHSSFVPSLLPLLSGSRHRQGVELHRHLEGLQAVLKRVIVPPESCLAC